MSLKEKFSAFRGGPGFIYTLCVFLLLWFGWNYCPYLPHFDRPIGEPAWTLLNLLMSIEATFAMPVLMMEQQRHGREESARLKEVLAATQELIRRMAEVEDDVELIAAEVADDADA
jgi:uncharacterized membrane protein